MSFTNVTWGLAMTSGRSLRFAEYCDDVLYLVPRLVLLEPLGRTATRR